jgi:hypothetical protein
MAEKQEEKERYHIKRVKAFEARITRARVMIEQMAVIQESFQIGEDYETLLQAKAALDRADLPAIEDVDNLMVDINERLVELDDIANALGRQIGREVDMTEIGRAHV